MRQTARKQTHILTYKITKLAKRFAKINYDKPARTKQITKVKFSVSRILQKKKVGLDNEYRYNNGWLGKSRPWKS